MNTWIAPLPKHLFRGPNLAGLLALYESNYARLWRLFPLNQHHRYQLVSHVPNDYPLHLYQLQRSRYTTTYQLTYFFLQDGRWVADPDLHVRVYHDAHQAESIFAGSNPSTFLHGRVTKHHNALRQKWELNILLNKWLRYCLDHGHHFKPALDGSKT